MNRFNKNWIAKGLMPLIAINGTLLEIVYTCSIILRPESSVSQKTLAITKATTATMAGLTSYFSYRAPGLKAYALRLSSVIFSGIYLILGGNAAVSICYFNWVKKD